MKHICKIYCQDDSASVVHSEFPHPLVTLDFDKDGHLVAVTSPGVAVEEFKEAL